GPGLYLVNVADLPEFRDVYRALVMVGFYNLNPASMRAAQAPDQDGLLSPDGGNIASVFKRIQHERPGVKERIDGYLSSIVPEVAAVDHDDAGPWETLKFRRPLKGSGSH